MVCYNTLYRNVLQGSKDPKTKVVVALNSDECNMAFIYLETCDKPKQLCQSQAEKLSRDVTTQHAEINWFNLYHCDFAMRFCDNVYDKYQ